MPILRRKSKNFFELFWQSGKKLMSFKIAQILLINNDLHEKNHKFQFFTSEIDAEVRCAGIAPPVRAVGETAVPLNAGFLLPLSHQSRKHLIGAGRTAARQTTKKPRLRGAEKSTKELTSAGGGTASKTTRPSPPAPAWPVQAPKMSEHQKSHFDCCRCWS